MHVCPSPCIFYVVFPPDHLRCMSPQLIDHLRYTHPDLDCVSINESPICNSFSLHVSIYHKNKNKKNQPAAPEVIPFPVTMRFLLLALATSFTVDAFEYPQAFRRNRTLHSRRTCRDSPLLPVLASFSPSFSAPRQAEILRAAK